MHLSHFYPSSLLTIFRDVVFLHNCLFYHPALVQMEVEASLQTPFESDYQLLLITAAAWPVVLNASNASGVDRGQVSCSSTETSSSAVKSWHSLYN